MAVPFSGRPPLVAVPSLNPTKTESSTPNASAIKGVLVGRLASTKSHATAAEYLQDSEVHLAGDEFQIQTKLSKTMLPVVMNADVERLFKATLREYGASGIKVTLLPSQAPPAGAVSDGPKKSGSKQEGLKGIDESFKRLSNTAAKLNEISDLLSTQVEHIDGALKRLNLGVTAWVRVKYDEDEDGNCYVEEVGYTKFGNRWCVALKTTSGVRGDPGEPDTSSWPFADAPRQVRIRAAQYLPTLIDSLCNEADKLIEQLKPSVEDLTQLAGALALTAGGR